jgi:hypothetical protein
MYENMRELLKIEEKRLDEINDFILDSNNELINGLKNMVE